MDMPSNRVMLSRSMSGQTGYSIPMPKDVLVLCDALTYAARFDLGGAGIAHLTGACVIALGGVRAACLPRMMRWPMP